MPPTSLRDEVLDAGRPLASLLREWSSPPFPADMPATARLLAVGLLLLGAAAAAEAQVHLYGRVIEDASEQPIAGADVVLQDARGRVVASRTTDELGQFRFLVEQTGPVRLRVGRVGYRPVTTPELDFGDYTLFSVEVRLAVEAVLLAPLEVVGRSRSSLSPTLAGFERRRQGGTGWYVTRADIERQKPDRVTDLLATAPGVAIHRRIVFMGRAGGCPAQIYVDGFLLNRPTPAGSGMGPGRRTPSSTEMFPIDDVVKPDVVEGIEVYQGLSRVPPEFLSPEAACGVVAVWTRRGG